jgi:hypothetical protein
MKRTRFIATIALLSIACCFQSQALTSYAQDKNQTAIARLLDQSGYTYTKAADGVWAIPFKGKGLTDFNVVVATQQDIAVIFAIVAEKKNFRVTPEAMGKLLRLNSDLDRVKIGIDEEGDTFARVDLSIRILDGQEFKANIEQVAAAADVVYGAIKPYLTPAK